MTELVILILIVGFVFLNGKIAKGKGYPFWAGAISGIIAFLGTILFLVLPSKIKKSLDDKNEELVRQQENSNSKQVKKKSKLLIILGAVLAVVIILYFYGTYLGKNDEKFNKNIVGTYSYSYTDKFEEGTTAKINGVKVFNSNGTCMDSAVWVVSIIDVYGNKSTLKYEIKSKGEYKIDVSHIEYDYKIENIKIKSLRADDFLEREFFNELYLTEIKENMVKDNEEEIIELTDEYIKTKRDNYNLETIVVTYDRQTQKNSSSKSEVKEQLKYDSSSQQYEFGGEFIPQISETNKIDKTFLEFWKEFKKSRASQIALINLPLKVIFTGWDKEKGEYYKEREELWDKNKLDKDWIIMKCYENNDIAINEDAYGWWGNGNFVVLNHEGDGDTPYSYFTSIFKKINGNWCLYYYDNPEFK